MLDKIDQKIISVLQEDASLSTHKISKKTLIPQTTVLHRIKKLKNLGIIKKYTINLDYSKIGKKVKALIFVKVDKRLTTKSYGGVGVIETILIKEEPILNIKRLMGRYDFVIEVICEDVQELDKFLHKRIRSIEAIADTETLVVLNEWEK